MTRGCGWAAVDPLPVASVSSCLRLLRQPSQHGTFWKLLSHILEVGSPRARCRQTLSEEDPLSMVEGEELSGVSFIGDLIPFMRLHPYDLSTCHNLLLC